MQILLTGGAGFIGSHIAERLLDRGHGVRVVDDLSAGRAANLPAGVAFHQASVLDAHLPALCQGCDAVVHAAAQTAVSASVQDPARDALLNAIGTIRALSAARAAGARRFVFLSSAAVYGTAGTPPILESQPPAPSSPYGLSKWAGERYVALLAGDAQMDWCILRLANVYGPRQSSTGEAGVVARWCAALADGTPIDLFGDGGQTRDFVYVGDVAAAVARAVESDQASGRTLHISTGLGVPLRQLLGLLEELSGRAAQVRLGPPRPGDIYHSALDPGLVRQVLGWEAVTPLREGLAETLLWAHKQSGRRF